MKRYYKINLCWGTSEIVTTMYETAEEGENPVVKLTKWMQQTDNHNRYLFDDNKPIIIRVFDTTDKRPVIVWTKEEFKHPNGKLYEAGKWYDHEGNESQRVT